MSECLPYGEFKWLTSDEISRSFHSLNSFCFDSMDKNKNIGYILEVDLKYLSELHNLHNDYPLAPKKMRVSDSMLSKYCRDIAKKMTLS